MEQHILARSADVGPLASDLARCGYLILRDLVAPSAIAEIEADLSDRFEATPFCEGGFYGERTKRFGRLLIRSPGMADLVMHPIIQGLTEQALGPWCDRIQLNLAQAIEIHPGALAQFPHRDQDMWAGEIGRVEYDRALELPMIAPLLSQPLVEFGLGVASWQWSEGGQDRALARRAFADVVPPQVLARRSKGRILSVFLPAFADNRAALREFLLEGWLAGAGILDRDAVAAGLERGVGDPLSIMRMLEVADLEAWARSVS